ncbi:MAG TPA: glucose 1-dehydrogenase [Dongiaceae bacterium]|nr:glucose 1-dehydrogenase [Dongiaceae bacterium]
MNIFDLSGRRALVTGSTRGIGLALAGGLGRAGAAIVLNGRDAAALDAAAAQLKAAGISATGKSFDVTDRAAIVAAVDAIEAEQGPIDILINNAGMQHRAPLEDFPEEAWHRLMRTNLDSAFFVGQAVARHMIARRRGAIINVGSVQSELGRPGIAPYAASKGGLKMLTKGMAIDWGKHGIRVNGLNPGYFKTELNAALVKDAAFSDWLVKRTPLGRWGDVEELIGAAVFLASDAASFVTGHILFVDGGVTSQL